MGNGSAGIHRSPAKDMQPGQATRPTSSASTGSPFACAGLGAQISCSLMPRAAENVVERKLKVLGVTKSGRDSGSNLSPERRREPSKQGFPMVL